MAANRLRTVETDGLVGRVLLGKYRVDAILGHGGSGLVAACTHLALNERVAIKMLRENALDSEESVERFMREAQAAAKLRSDYVARVTDVGKLETDVPYMVMELLDGQDLGKLIERHGSLPAASVADLTIQAADALSEAHSHGIIHRDVKPSNLFVTTGPDDGWMIKVLDFGISKTSISSEMRLTQTLSLLGTPAYMSPEQMRSARLVDTRTDIYSLGTVMYEALEGRLPFPAESFSEMCLKVSSDPMPAMVLAPAKLQQVVARCLEKDPDQRYQTMAQLARDLVRFAPDPARAAMLVGRMENVTRRSLPQFQAVSPPEPERRPRWRLVVLPIAAIAIGTSLGLWVGGRGDEPPADPPAATVVAPSPPTPTPTPAPAPPPAVADEPVEIDPPPAAPAKQPAAKPPIHHPPPRHPQTQTPAQTTKPKPVPCKADERMDGC